MSKLFSKPLTFRWAGDVTGSTDENGSIHTEGGASIEKSLYVGNVIHAESGIDAHENVISHVANATADDHAVNMGLLKEVDDRVTGRLNGLSGNTDEFSLETDQATEKWRISSAGLGAGLKGGSGAALEVNADGQTILTDTGDVRVNPNLFLTQLNVGDLDTGPPLIIDEAGMNVNGRRITGLPAASAGPTDAVSRAELNATEQGLTLKDGVRCATLGNITIATDLVPGGVIDGITLTTGDRVLVKDQGAAPVNPNAPVDAFSRTSHVDNGIYIVGTSPTRSEDFALGADVLGCYVFVELGTVNAVNGYVVRAGRTVGTDALTFSQFTGLGDVIAGSALSMTGNQMDVKVDAGSLEIVDDKIRLKSAQPTVTQLGTQGTLAVTGLSSLGPVNLSGALNAINGATVADPTAADHATTRRYVDGAYTAAAGISKTPGTGGYPFALSVNASQPQITQVGDLANLKVVDGLQTASTTATFALTSTGRSKLDGQVDVTGDINITGVLNAPTTLSQYQPVSGVLSGLATAVPTLNNLLVGSGTSWQSVGAAAGRIALALGTLATKSTVTLTTDVTGILPVANFDSANIVNLGTLNQLNVSGVSSFARTLTIGPNPVSGTPSATTGRWLDVPNNTFTDSTSNAGVTVSDFAGLRLGRTTLTAANAVTTTTASTLYIDGPPQAGANQTVASAYALNVGSGATKLAAVQATSVAVSGALSATGATTLGGQLNVNATYTLMNTAGAAGAYQINTSVFGYASGTNQWFTNVTAGDTVIRALGASNANGTLRIGTINSAASNLDILANGSVNVNSGALNLTNASTNLISYANSGLNPPAFTTRSTGTKIALFPGLSATTTDYAIGVESANMWMSVGDNSTNNGFKWYGGTTQAARLDGAGSLTLAGNLTAAGVALGPLGRYPPVALNYSSSTTSTTTVTGQPYGNGTYVASVSTNNFSFAAFTTAFSLGTFGGWSSANGTYVGTTGMYAGAVSTTVSGAAVAGEWIQLSHPSAYLLRRVVLTAQTYQFTQTMPRSIVIAGSNDGTTWTNLASFSSVVSYTSGVSTSFDVNATVGYSIYRVIVREVGFLTSGGTGQSNVLIGQVAMYSYAGEMTINAPTAATHASTRGYVDGLSYLVAGAGLTKAGNALSVNAVQTQITSVGTLTGLTVTGATIVPEPTDASHAATRGYVDSVATSGTITAGTGLTKAGNALSVNATQTQITSVGTLTGLTVTGATVVPEPTDATHASTRGYVDGLTYLTAGAGLTKTSGSLSVNAAQTQITSVGTLTGLTVAGTTIVPEPTAATHAATRGYVDAQTTTAGAGLTKTGTALAVNAAQPTVTSLGTLTGLTVGGPVNVNATYTTMTTAGASGGYQINNSAFGYAGAAGQWFTNATNGDTIIRALGASNAAGTLRIGTINGVASNLDILTNGSVNINSGTLNLTNPNTNVIAYANAGLNPPAFTTRSTGTKITLFPGLSATTTEYAIGVESGNTWMSVGDNSAGNGFKWYGGTTQAARLDGAGNMTVAGGLTATGTSGMTINGPQSITAVPAYAHTLNSGVFRYTLDVNNVLTDGGYIRYLDIASAGVQDGNSGGGAIRFLTNSNTQATAIERMRIRRDGSIAMFGALSVAGASTLTTANAQDVRSELFGGNETSLVYPPTGAQILTMDGDNTVAGLAYGNGTYTIAGSTIYSAAWSAYLGFVDASVASPPNSWSSATGTFNAAGAYTGGRTTVDAVTGTSYAGEWIEVSLPQAKYVTSVSIFPRQGHPTNAPTTFVIMAGPNNTNLRVVFAQTTAVTWTEATRKTLGLTTPGMYTCIRIVCMTIGANATGGPLAQLTFSLKATHPYMSITNTTDSVRLGTGALVVPGGASVAKALNVGTTLAVAGASTFTGAVTIPEPTLAAHASTRGYVDGLTYLTAGAGLTKAGNALSVNAAQTQITSVGTLTALTVTGTTVVPDPTAATHASTRGYVDGLTYLTAGAGLTKTGNALSVNAAQTQITSLGTLTGLTIGGPLNVNATYTTMNTAGATGGYQINNAAFGYAAGASQFFTNVAAGDTIIRALGASNVAGTLRIGTINGAASNLDILANGSVNVNSGALNMLNGTSNVITYTMNGVNPPSLNARSTGTKLSLFPGLTTTSTDYAMGVEGNHLWQSTYMNDPAYGFKWYGGATQVARLDGAGNLTASGGITSGGTIKNPVANVYGPGQYPPVGLTSATTTISGQVYGNGAYIVTASSQLVGFSAAWTAFNLITGADEGWHSNDSAPANSYTAATGMYSGTTTTTVSGTAILGEWLQMQSPTAFALKSTLISPRNGGTWNGTGRGPRSFVIAGSNDGSTWTSVYATTGVQDWGSGAMSKTFAVGASAAYSYYRLIVREVGNLTSGATTSSTVNICEWQLFDNHMFMEVTSTAESSDVNSGALQVDGGVGIAKSLNVGGAMTAGGTIKTSLANLYANGQYPPAPLTAPTTTLSGQVYGNGTYVASVSSSYSPWAPISTMFNNVTTTEGEGWHSELIPAYAYTTATGYYGGTTTTTVGGTAVLGEWLQLQSPSAFSLKSTVMFPRPGYGTTRMPRSFVIAGSNDGVTWTSVYAQTGVQDWLASGGKTFTIGASATYTYYRLIVREVGNPTSGSTSSNCLNMSEWQLFDNHMFMEVTSTAESTSPATGAFQVDGGIGVAKSLNVGGALTAAGASTLTTASAQDVRSEIFGGNETSLLYPPTGAQILTMDGDNTVAGLPYGNGTYTIAGSTTFSAAWSAYLGFQDTSVATSWSSATGTFNAAGAYTGGRTTVDVGTGTSYAGEWIEVSLPQAKYVTSVSIFPRLVQPLNAPTTFVIMAGPNNTNLRAVFSQTTAVTWTEATRKTLGLTTPGMYTCIRIVCMTIGANAPTGYFSQLTFSLKATHPYVSIPHTTDSVRVGSGALVVPGGASVAKAMNVGTTLTVAGTTTLNGATNLSGQLTLVGNTPTISTAGGSIGPLSIDPNFSTNGYVRIYDDCRVQGDFSVSANGTTNLFAVASATGAVTIPGTTFAIGGGTTPGLFRTATSISDYTLLGTNVTDGATNTRIVVSGNTRSTSAGSIDYLATGTGQHVFWTGGNTQNVSITAAGALQVLSGILNLTNATSNTISFGTGGLNPPAFGSRSTGTRLVLYPNVGASMADYAMGVEANHIWQSVAQANDPATGMKWYAGTTVMNKFAGDGRVIMGNALIPAGSVAATGDARLNLQDAAGIFTSFYAGTTKVGSITSTGTTSTNYNTMSDYRLKENITELTGEDAVERLKRLPVRRFNFVGSNQTVDGMLAHQVQEIVPEAVTGELNAVDINGKPIYQMLDASRLIPILVSSLQNALARIETLEGIITR